MNGHRGGEVVKGSIATCRALAILLAGLGAAAVVAACEPEPTDTPSSPGALVATMPGAGAEVGASGTALADRSDRVAGDADAGADEGDGEDQAAGGTADAGQRDGSSDAGQGADGDEGAELDALTLMLDWVPNTNHAGLFLAEAAGLFAAEGLDVEIVQPGEVFAEQAVAAGTADVGVSYQEALTLARADGVPLVSIAAILQHNTSGFASLPAAGVEGPADFEGLRYGSFGSPFEQPTLHGLMRCAAGETGRQIDLEALEIVEVGFSEPLTLLQSGRIDLAWIFEGWQGVQAEREGLELDIVRMSDHLDCIPDYYTPILFTSEATLAEKPDALRAFMAAASAGYTGAIERPDAAVAALSDAAPEIDPGLIEDSLAWLAPHVVDDAPRWGHQQLSVWSDYALWLEASGVIDAGFDPASAFTNDLLPGR